MPIDILYLPLDQIVWSCCQLYPSKWCSVLHLIHWNQAKATLTVFYMTYMTLTKDSCLENILFLYLLLFSSSMRRVYWNLKTPWQFILTFLYYANKIFFKILKNLNSSFPFIFFFRNFASINKYSFTVELRKSHHIQFCILHCQD